MNNKKTVRVVSDLVTFKITSEETGGAYSLFETQTPPQAGSPRHIEHREEEAFFVLEGEYTFTHGDERLILGPGEHLLVQRGTPHSFMNSGDTMARMLITTSPGGLHEQFFNEVGVPVDQEPAGPPDFGKMVASGMKYGIEILPPPR